MGLKFSRNIEDFTCANCGEKIKGNGYTNHCPKCLWSRHVDIFPGDRANECGGNMKPIGYETKGGRIVLIHRCESCGEIKRNKMQPEDDMSLLANLEN